MTYDNHYLGAWQCQVNGQKVTGQKVTRHKVTNLVGQKVTGQKVTNNLLTIVWIYVREISWKIYFFIDMFILKYRKCLVILEKWRLI